MGTALQLKQNLKREIWNFPLQRIQSSLRSPVWRLYRNIPWANGWKRPCSIPDGNGNCIYCADFISLLIGCFRYIGKLEDKINGKAQAQEPAPAPLPVVSAPAAEEEEELVDNLELVAVITAAIAASEGSSPSGLVVRSIRRAPAGKWKKA